VLDTINQSFLRVDSSSGVARRVVNRLASVLSSTPADRRPLPIGKCQSSWASDVEAHARQGPEPHRSGKQTGVQSATSVYRAMKERKIKGPACGLSACIVASPDAPQCCLRIEDWGRLGGAASGESLTSRRRAPDRTARKTKTMTWLARSSSHLSCGKGSSEDTGGK
jgi:hypothetical protein